MSREKAAWAWDPATYLRFGSERERPYFELVARIGADEAADVVDLGCGPGGLTATLLRRWPSARIEGIDSSPEMIEAAAPHAVPGSLRFRVGDVRSWSPDRPVDVIVSNAALQWVGGGLDLLDRLVAALAPGGWLAYQVPYSIPSPAHSVLRELCHTALWRDRLSDALWPPHPLASPQSLPRLHALGCTVDAWETTYLHVLQGDDAVVGWMRGTTLRPLLARLSGPEQERFLDEYRQGLAPHFPVTSAGTVLPFRRVFTVARTSS
ncbi:MAG TPA: methyltransferase domain-containing protein [Candidatus Dormibacteraeota bacterium]|jgi:trans-aconitate 2-methyltransferase|nr:methyltransferase domain-containing protein [Candidatus Dormibacteraeota bacterium]